MTLQPDTEDSAESAGAGIAGQGPICGGIGAVYGVRSTGMLCAPNKRFTFAVFSGLFGCLSGKVTGCGHQQCPEAS